MTFQELLDQSAELRMLDAQAKTAARHSEREWYPEWVSRCYDVRDAARAIAEAASLNTAEVLKVVRAGLEDSYNVARQRIARKAK